MNKKEASEMLGVSVRLVERYAAEGRLGEVRYVRGKTGKQADFAPEAVEALKASLESVDAPALAPYSPAAGLVAPEMAGRLISALEAISAHLNAPNSPVASLAEPPELLTPEDVADRLKLKTETVKRLAREGKLGHVRIGRLYRFRPEDLRAFIEKL